MTKIVCLIALVFLWTTSVASAQVNNVNSIVFGSRGAQFEGDPYAGAGYLQTAGDFTARPLTSGADIVIFSPVGEYFLTARSTMAWLWNSVDGANLAQMPHGSSIDFVSFAPNGSYVLVCSGNNAKLWSAPGGSFRGEIVDNDTINSAVISRDSRFIATINNSGFTLWNGYNGLMLWRMPMNGAVTSLVFSPDCTRLATICGGTASLFLTADGARVGDISNAARGATFSPDGRYLIVGDYSWAHLWDPIGFRKISDIQYGSGYK